MGYDLNQDETVDDQKEQSSEPDQQESVVAFKLQEVGRAQPNALVSERRYNSYLAPGPILVLSFKTFAEQIQV